MIRGSLSNDVDEIFVWKCRQERIVQNGLTRLAVERAHWKATARFRLIEGRQARPAGSAAQFYLQQERLPEILPTHSPSEKNR